MLLIAHQVTGISVPSTSTGYLLAYSLAKVHSACTKGNGWHHITQHIQAEKVVRIEYTNLRSRTRREKRRLTLRMALLPLGPFFIIIIIIIIIVRFVHVPVITLSSALCLVPLMPLNIQGGTSEKKKKDELRPPE